jgi:hypothetical protein
MGGMRKMFEVATQNPCTELLLEVWRKVSNSFDVRN